MKIAKLIEYRYALTALSRSRAFNAQTWTDIRVLLSKITAAVPSELIARLEEIEIYRQRAIEKARAEAIENEAPADISEVFINILNDLKIERDEIEGREIEITIDPLKVIGLPASDRFEATVPIPFQDTGLKIDPWIAFNNLLDEGIITCVPEPAPAKSKPTKPAKK